MKDNELILTLKKNGILQLPWGFLYINNLKEGELLKITVERYNPLKKEE